MQTIKDQEKQFFNKLAIDVLTNETDPVLRDELSDVLNEIAQGTRKVTKSQYDEKSLELYLQKEGKQQYLKLNSGGDYTYISDFLVDIK